MNPDLKHSRAYAGGKAAAATNRGFFLRKVVEEVEVEIIPGVFVPRQRLECGHDVGMPHDMIGPYYPGARRCRYCPKPAKPLGPELARAKPPTTDSEAE